MNKVKVTYWGLIQPVVENKEEENYLSDDATVGELVRLLVERHGDRFKSMVLTSNGQLHPLVTIQVNGRDIDEIDGLDTRLEANSELSVTVTPYLIVAG